MKKAVQQKGVDFDEETQLSFYQSKFKTFSILYINIQIWNATFSNDILYFMFIYVYLFIFYSFSCIGQKMVQYFSNRKGSN